MKKLYVLLFIIFIINAQAINIHELFDAIKRQPSSKIDELSSKMAQVAQNKVNAGYYPNINLFAEYAHYNSPTNLIPLDPDTTAQLAGKSIPFAQTIQKAGINVSLPLFVKELSDLSLKAKYLAKSVKLKKELNFYQNEALILGSNASLEYLENLLKTLHSTQNSIQKTKYTLQLSVNSGRMPGISIDKIDEKLNQLEININNVNMKKASLVSNIENITGIEIKKSVQMELMSSIKTDGIFSLKPLQEVINASISDYMASRAKRYYPKVAFNVMWSENYAQNDSRYGQSVHNGYGFYQLGIYMPLYNRGADIDIQLKKIAIMKNKMKFKKTEQQLKSQVKALQKQLVLLEKSKQLKSLNIQKKEDLLRYAKVSFDEGRMSEEDYLGYEDGLLGAKSSYYETLSAKWQNIAKLAVIYGNDLKGIVK